MILQKTRTKTAIVPTDNHNYNVPEEVFVIFA